MTEKLVGEMTDHDILIRLDEKMNTLSQGVSALVISTDQRGADIEELKTAKLLHEQETKQQEKDLENLRFRMTSVEDRVTKNKESVDKSIEIIRDSSILLWMQTHPRISSIMILVFLIMLNFHDIIIPWLFSLFGYRTP